jgi:hypothetical protein
LILAPLLDTIFNKAILSTVVQGWGFGSIGAEDFAFVFFGAFFEVAGSGWGLDLDLGFDFDLDMALDLDLDSDLGLGLDLGNAGDSA